MMRHVCCIAAAILALSFAPSVRGEQLYIYEPKAVPPGEKPQLKRGQGVLVQDVQVVKGDTLSGISRKYSGRSSYYPQILLFNDISDPDMIIAGDTLKIPVTKTEAISRKGKGSSDSKNGRSKHVAHSKPAVKKSAGVPVTKVEKRKSREQLPPERDSGIQAAAVEQPPVAAQTSEVPPVAAASSAGQKVYDRAIKAYRQNDYRQAIELFDRFLGDNGNSPLAADASLYKAECYLKLSGQ